MDKQIVKAEDVALATLSVAVPEPEDVTVIAANAQQLGMANGKLIAWCEAKIAAKQSQLADAEENLRVARKNKWRSRPFEAIVRSAQSRITFYEKIKAALEAGFSIVPNMDMEVFAVRTAKKNPRGNQASRTDDASWGSRTPFVKDQKTDSSPVGEGKYVAPSAVIQTHTNEFTDGKGQKKIQTTAYASEFDDEIDFPFKLAKTKILGATAEAMALKIFDEVGMLPRVRGADPMIIGRIGVGSGFQRKNVCFVISWFVDTREL